MTDVCKYWWKPKCECIKMTKILQDNGVSGFHAIQDKKHHGQRMCHGNIVACYFRTNGKEVVE